jgi:zinc protease
MNKLLLALLFSVMSFSAHADIKVQQVKTAVADALLIEDGSLPLISVQLTFKGAGVVTDTEPLLGRGRIAHAAMSEGAGNMNARTFSETLDFHAIKLSNSIGLDHAAISMTTLSEHKDTAFKLMGMMITKPRYELDDVLRIKQEYLTDLKQLREKPSYILQKTFNQKAFDAHPYGRMHYGDDASIAKIMPDNLHAYSKKFFARDNLIISVSGDVNAEELKQLIDKHLSGLSEKAEVVALPDVALKTQAEPLFIDAPYPQTSIQIAMKGISRKDKDFYPAYVMNHILGGSGLAARLGQAIRQERGFTYSVGSYLSMNDAAQWIGVNFSTQNATAKEALNVAKAVVALGGEKGFTASELQDAKSNITGSFPLDLDSNAERVSYLDMMQLYDLGVNYLDKRNAYIDAVTLEQVNKVAADYLQTKNTLSILVGNTKEQ